MSMDLVTFSRRLRRADLLDGLGIYVDAESLSLAHVSKRLLRVTLKHGRSYPLAPASRPEERARALSQAVEEFVRDFGIEPGGVYLCLARNELLLNRLVLPAAARENLDQVLEYEVERVIPVPRDEIFYDYQVRESGGGEAGRLAVLVVCVPRRVVRGYIDALEAVGVRLKAVVTAAGALGDYAAFCRRMSDAPLAIVARSGGELELALFVGRQLIASHALRSVAMPPAAELEQMIRRDLAEVFHPSEADIELLYGERPGGAPMPADARSDLFALANGYLEAPAEFFAQPEARLLPAIGAALGAVREGVVDLNLLPEEHRPGLQEGLFVTLILLAAVIVLTIVFGGSVVVRDEVTRRSLAREVSALEPQVQALRKQEAKARKLEAQMVVLTTDQDRRMAMYLKELTERIPTDAYISTLRYRNGRIEIDGFAKKSSELIQVLEDSSMFRNVQFASPTTAGSAGQERFSIIAEAEE